MSFADQLQRLREAAAGRQRGDQNPDLARVLRRDLRDLIEDFDRLDRQVRALPPPYARLSDDEWKVLTFLARNSEYAFGMKGIGSQTQVPSTYVPHIVRLLAAKGLTKFRRGLFDEDGMAAGSGYSATPKGLGLVYGPKEPS